MGEGSAFDYRDILRSEFEKRNARNARYSMRSFARDLQFSVSSLSLVLKGKQGLSSDRAKKLAQAMRLKPIDRDLFVCSVKLQHAREPKTKIEAAKRISKLLIAREDKNPKVEKMAALNQWYHCAIVECVRGFPKISLQSLARTLSLPMSTVDKALRGLQNAEIIRWSKGGWLVENEIIWVKSPTSSRIIRNFHHQIIERAKGSIEAQDISERDLSALYFLFAVDRLAEFQEEMMEIRRHLVSKYAAAESNSEVYCLSQQFFKITNQLKEGK